MGTKETYISVDVETAGQVPSLYALLSIGACNVEDTSQNFYIELKPDKLNFIPENLKVANLSLEKLQETGVEPLKAMELFEEWIKAVSQDSIPVFTAFNATFDWLFIDDYFWRYRGKNPFGISGFDLKAYYKGKFNTSWKDTSKRRLRKDLLPPAPHTHNALDDAIEQAMLYKNMRDYRFSLWEKILRKIKSF